MAIAIPLPKSAPAFDETSAPLLSRVAARAASYFPQLDRQSLQTRLVRSSCRPYSACYEFDVSDTTQTCSIIVKIPFLPLRGSGPVQSPQLEGRPRLFGLVDPQQMAGFEFASLCAIAEHVEGLGDPRLGAIRPLELMHDPQAVVMEKSGAAGLRNLHRAAGRFRTNPASLPFSPRHAVRNTGFWLRQFHRLEPLQHTLDRMASRDEFIDALLRQTGYLMDHGMDRSFLRAVRAELEYRVRHQLPSRFELVTSHGDFAPRNVLVGGDNRVTVLDTLARWRAPRFEDVASFLLALRATAAQVVTFGLAYRRPALAEYEAAFLRQYFGDEPLPLVPIRLFESLLLLDRWSAFVQRHRQATGRHKAYTTWRLVTLRRYLARYYRHTFREIAQIS